MCESWPYYGVYLCNVQVMFDDLAMYHKISALVCGTYPVYVSVRTENILAEDFHVYSHSLRRISRT